MHEAGRQGGAGERHGDRPEQLPLGRAVDPGRVLEIAIDAGDAGPRGADEERRRDERHGEDHRDRRERDRDARGARTARTAARVGRRRAAGRGPATDGGSTIGRSTTASMTPLPRNRRRASTNASGSPSATVMTRLDGRRHEAQPEGVEDRGRGEGDPQRAVEDGPHDEGEDGQAEEQGEQAGEDGERPLRPSARPGRRPPGDRRCAPGCSPGGSVDHDGGRNPKPLRIAWPSRPGEPGQERPGGVGVRRGLDDDAGVGRRGRWRRPGRRPS